MNKYIGSNFNDYLQEEHRMNEVKAAAVKKTIAMDLQASMKATGLTKAQLAKNLHTSRSQIDRLLDPANTSVTLATLIRASNSLNKRLLIRLEPKKRRA